MAAPATSRPPVRLTPADFAIAAAQLVVFAYQSGLAVP
jgi:hypothetical protein